MDAIEDFRGYVILQGIENHSDILLHKIRLLIILRYTEILRRKAPDWIEADEKEKKFHDKRVSELMEWCKVGNEDRPQSLPDLFPP
jgi:hypothetical protein